MIVNVQTGEEAAVIATPHGWVIPARTGKMKQEGEV